MEQLLSSRNTYFHPVRKTNWVLSTSTKIKRIYSFRIQPVPFHWGWWNNRQFISYSKKFFLIRQSFYWKKDTSSPWVFSRIRVVQSLVFCVLLCRSLFDPLTFFLYSLSFYDFRFLITPLVSSSFFLKYYDTNTISFSCQSITFRSVLYSTALSAFTVHTYLRDQRYSNFFTEN